MLRWVCHGVALLGHRDEAAPYDAGTAPSSRPPRPRAEGFRGRRTHEPPVAAEPLKRARDNSQLHFG